MLRPLFSLAAMVALATIAVISFGPGRSALYRAKFTETTTQALPQTTNEPLKNISFTVYDVGMYPHELQVDAGRVAIAFEDHTGKNSGFVVQRITGNAEKVGEIMFPSDHWRTRGEVRLTAGRYRVFSRERPEIQSILIVNP
jgi:hypothetical protein